jgi:hypothetical protein
VGCDGWIRPAAAADEPPPAPPGALQLPQVDVQIDFVPARARPCGIADFFWLAPAFTPGVTRGNRPTRNVKNRSSRARAFHVPAVPTFGSRYIVSSRVRKKTPGLKPLGYAKRKPHHDGSDDLDGPPANHDRHPRGTIGKRQHLQHPHL